MGKPVPNLLTLEGARELAIDLQGVARKRFDEKGSHPLVGHLLATRAPPQSFFESTGQAPFAIPPGGAGVLAILANHLGCEGDRNRFAMIMQLMARVVEAVGTVTIFEGWYVAAPATMQAALAFRRTLPRDLGDYPDRKEGIVMVLEHAKSKGPIMWHAMITREGDRGILGEFIEGGSKVQGRFTDHLGKQGAS